MTQFNSPEISPFWLAPALENLLEKEVIGQNNNQKIIEYFNEAGHPQISSDEVPWCAAFVGSMLKKSGIKSTNSLLARSYLSWGAELAQPRMGAIAVFKRGANPDQGHVGFVISTEADHIYILGGNQNDQVNITSYQKSNLISLRWPILVSHETSAALVNADFYNALSHTLKLEGGWSDHKDDPGGPTNKGITLKTFINAQNNAIIPKVSTDQIAALKNISDKSLSEIYFQLYWKKAHCYLFPRAIAIMLFDAAVNHGPLRAKKFLQQALGAEVDGEVGPQTLSHYSKFSPNEVLENLTEARRQFYLNSKQFPVFGKGWLNRLTAISKQAISNLNQPTRVSTQTKETNTMTTTSKNDQKWWGESLTIWGTIVTALSTILPVLGPFIGFDISADLIQQFGETVARLIQLIGGVTGTSMAIIGRTRATTTLTRRSMNVKI